MKGNQSKNTIIFIIGMLPFVMVLGNSMLIPILPTIQSDLNITAFEGGLILTVFAVPAAIIIPFIGFLSDRIGRKRMITISLILIMAGSVVSIFAVKFLEGTGGFSWLLIGRFFQGIGAGGTSPIAMALVADIFQGKDRSQALGIIEVFNGAGKVVSPMIGALAAVFFWYSALYFYFAVSLLSLLGIIFYINERQSSKERDSLPDYKQRFIEAFKREGRWLLPIFFVGGTGLFLLFGMLFFLSYEIEVIFQVDGFLKGIVFAVPLGALTVISYWTGKQIGSDIPKMKTFMFIGLSLMFVSFSLLIYFHEITGLIFGLTVASAGLGLVLPCANMLITSSVSGKERGLIVSLYGMTRFLGVALGPIIYSIWMTDLVDMFLYSLLLLGTGIVWLYVSLHVKKVEEPLLNK
ncbi:MFS transporter [Anaerobacillus sp. MEB173]|uniref:MFS transporter n=1 Tax=Anaerobacillus sp. MEB173 TaxID=3383345 RepID=UPI003F91FCD2